jgi:hypothetical protein
MKEVPMSDPTREFLRLVVATIAYRGGKTVRDAPESFAAFGGGEAARTPAQILAHIGDLFDWALSLVKGAQQWHNAVPQPWGDEAARVFESIARFDAYMASDAPLAAPAERLLQGPLADALTHVGQLAMLRRLAGAPIRGENYYVAEIAIGRVGLEQSNARREF